MQKNKIFTPANLARLALVAAVYAALTLAVAPLSYGAVQFRVSEMLVILCFYRKDYAVSLTLGCLIANLFSPMGLMDIIFGTLATAAAVFPMFYMKNIFLAAALPVVSNAFIVGFELYLFGEPFWFGVGSVALGEAAVVLAGALIFKFIIEKNRTLMRLLGAREARQ